MSLISIVVPYYNRSHLLTSLINTVVRQTHRNWELIIVDDCSDDSLTAQEIISDVNDPRIIYCRHERNKNGAQARNTGIDIASGDYLAFLDSDDYWVEDKLAHQLDVIQSRSNQEMVIVYSALFREYEGQNTEAEILPKLAKKDRQSVGDYLFIDQGLMQTSTLFMTLQTAKKVKFNPELRRHQDYDFVLSAENKGVDFVFVDKPLCRWICLENESSVAKKGASLALSLTWFMQYKKFLSNQAQQAYVGKHMFYIAFKNRRLPEYYKLVLTRFSPLFAIKSIFANAIYVITRR